MAVLENSGDSSEWTRRSVNAQFVIFMGMRAKNLTFVRSEDCQMWSIEKFKVC